MKKAFGWLVLGVFLTVSGVQAAAAPAGHPVHKQASKRNKKVQKKNGKPRKAAPRNAKNKK